MVVPCERGSGRSLGSGKMGMRSLVAAARIRLSVAQRGNAVAWLQAARWMASSDLKATSGWHVSRRNRARVKILLSMGRMSIWPEATRASNKFKAARRIESVIRFWRSLLTRAEATSVIESSDVQSNSPTRAFWKKVESGSATSNLTIMALSRYIARVSNRALPE